MALQWLSADLRTGRIIADLPSLEVDWPLRRTIGTYDTATAHLNLSGAPENWERATLEGAAVLAVYDDDDPFASILWAGWVSFASRSSENVVDLTLATLEAYLDRRFVGDLDYFDVGQNAIIADLVAQYVVDGVEPGIQLAVVTDGPGALREREYFDTDNSTVYSRSTELAALRGGPEFTVEWAWSADRQSLEPTLHVQTRVGTAKAPDMASANAVFEYPGSVTKVTETRDYSSGQGANKVQAYSSGQGDSTPFSATHLADDFQGRPTFEFRWQPSTNVDDETVLDDYAVQALKFLAPGARALTLSAALAEAPRLGVDWHLGDDVGYRIGGLDENGRDTAPAWPGGIAGIGRAIAYELTDTELRPILAADAVYTEGA